MCTNDVIIMCLISGAIGNAIYQFMYQVFSRKKDWKMAFWISIIGFMLVLIAVLCILKFN